MKFLKEPTDKGLHIPRAALNLCGFEAGEKVELHTAENALVALKGRMTAMELLRAAQSLQQMAVELHTHQMCIRDSIPTEQMEQGPQMGGLS